MIKKMISFTRPQLEWLEAEAERLGISMAELSRRLIDQARHEGITQAPRPSLIRTEVCETRVAEPATK